MPSRILLISANRCTTPDPVFPLGLACLNSALRHAGHQTFWVDRLSGSDGFSECVGADEPDFVGISLRNIDDILIRRREVFFDELAGLVTSIRRHTTAPVIIGGSGFSIFPERLLELSGADYGIAGEGEGPLLQLIEALNSHTDYSAIPGLVFRKHDAVVANPPAPGAFSQPLAEADRPDAVAARYLDACGMLNIQTQRGCGFRCCYCTYPLIEGRNHRRRPPEWVADEFEQLQKRGARYVFVVDSVFNSSARHVTEICEALLRRNLTLSWGCFLRPQGLTDDLMNLMARAGLAHIEFGSDSFCDDVLHAYGKEFHFGDILHSSELARKNNVPYCHFLIAGGPGETGKTLRQGFANSHSLNGGFIMALPGMRIYPGTRLFEQAVAQGSISRDADLLSPAYYLAPGLTEEFVIGQLQEFARLSPDWIVGDPGPEYAALIRRLRQRGVTGPLWSYFSTLQRLWQAPAAVSSHS